jgi:hypothetical protein
MLPIFFGIVAMVLLIVCANLANLFLARASTRRQEIAVRRAIGAGRWRFNSAVADGKRAACTGRRSRWCRSGVLGKDFLSWLPASSMLMFDPQLDVRVLLFTAAVSLFTGLVFGIGPAIRATRMDLSPTMRLSAQKGGSRSLVRKSLLVAQVSISLILLVAAGLFINTVRNLQKVDVGFNTKNLLLFDISPRQRSNDPGRILQLYDAIAENIANIPVCSPRLCPEFVRSVAARLSKPSVSTALRKPPTGMKYTSTRCGSIFRKYGNAVGGRAWSFVHR